MIENPLLECLVIFTKLYNRPYSADALIADLPIPSGRVTPKLFSLGSDGSKSAFHRAAHRAGFSSKLVNYSFSDISPLLLPVILILKGDDKNEKACILTEISPDRKYAKIILPEVEDGENWVETEFLEAEYIDFAFLLKPEHHYKDAHKRLLKHEDRHWFWGTLAYSRGVYMDVIIASFLINLFVMASPIFTLNIYDRVVPNNAIDTMWIFATGIVVIYIFDIVLKFLRSYFLENAAKKSDVIMSSMIYEHVLNLKIASKPRSVGSFASNLKDFDSIRGFFTASSIATMIDLPFTIIFLFIIYIIGGWLIAIPLISSFVIIIYSAIVEKPMRRSVQSTYEASAHKNSVLIESLSALETIKALGISGQYQWKWEEATGDVAQKGLKSKILSNSISTFVNFVVQLNTVALVIGGVYAIGEKTLSMGGLIAVVMLGSRMLAPLGQVASLIANFQQTKTAYDAINSIMKLDVEREEGKNFVERPSFKGKIEFQHVSFTYPNTDHKILDDVSFIINPGEAVGIIGTNGSGKTTIEKLILGLYEPTDGSVLIDGIDIKQIDPADLRRNISYVPQDVVLFQGTLKDNIILRSPDASDENILYVSKLSGVSDFADIHPMGYDMPVGERGDGLSGGQKQSICVARAFIHPAPIILLDEPTNSMDSTHENNFIRTIKSYHINRTMLLISHKNNLLVITQRLILMDKGKILLDGDYADVVKQLHTPKKVVNNES
ncbi:MAG: ABC transporter [Sulfurimonas sp. RIFCSPLOWO2_12_FULL_36_74]|uniref:type I secretion system permease/ATPase n=1 Tax=Sulfurimonas sp. RIFCSPLOWO2_12_36_12 TaxID=1802253 RepID=UPI0008CC3D7E|nr:type I secretion system permease/ATPase [Sulfurimonas sp. RIFCSPLOWO2_12_36_12]OHD98592.1 MAG: ABC transporter [Sulfurimonas sp. RIFCSPLOWO2_02_FULL_36_28]OHE02611.1 MAG: ABC transporter [Sulfurimonas sp. RIFCSPLOWO2_12_36_12]OHE06338.1 MAG: ABC transporter [Sulfurimonas sp. RIFCSPLOWO2_12_FULL_36_74]